MGIINNSIQRLNLDLKGKIVLTEVGSGNYCYTPIIALLAGAKQVYAWTKNSIHGKVKDISDKCLGLAKELKCDGMLEISEKRNQKHIIEADIITNSGFVRPLDSNILKLVNQSVAIPLMYEAWEIRDSDIDLKYCIENEIKVAGTWESHPEVQVFEYVGNLCVKLCMLAGYEIFKNKIIIWSNDNFGLEAKKAFKALNAEYVKVTNEVSEVYNYATDADLIFICDYDEQRNYFYGENAVFSLQKLKSINSVIGIVHLYGHVQYETLCEDGMFVFPKRSGKPFFMSETLSYIGLNPVIKLQVAGLKVGQELLEKKLTSLSQLISGKI